MEEESAKSPDGTEDKEELIDLLVGVGWCVLRRELCLQKVAERLDHAHLLDGRDHLEPVGAVDVQEDRDVAIKQDCQVGLLGLHLPFINPALDIPWKIIVRVVVMIRWSPQLLVCPE